MRKACLAALVLGCLALFGSPARADCTQVGPITGGSCNETPQSGGNNGNGDQMQQNTPDTQASERAFFDLINQERTSRGMRALAWHAVLTDIARNHSMHMAKDQQIYHNTSELESSQTQRRLGYPRMLGENVGVGPSTQWLHDEFMKSPEHRANILEPRYNYVGIGVVISDGSIWVTQDYMESAHAFARYSPPNVSPGALRRALAPVARSLQPPKADRVIIAPRQQVSALILPPIPAPRPLDSGGGTSSKPVLPLAILATLSAAGFASRRDSRGWI